MKPYKDLFIDFDDTLYDTRGSASKALEEFFKFYHLEEFFNSPEDFFSSYWQSNVSLWGQYAKGEIERDFLIVERFRRPLRKGNYPHTDDDTCLRMSDKFLDLCTSFTVIVDGAYDLLEYLKQKDYRMHLCSNGFREVQFKKLKNAKMTDYFQSVILSEDAGANKPSSQFFDYALKISGAKKEETLMIGDNYDTDIVGARNAGIDTLLFNRWDANFLPPGKVSYIVGHLADIKNVL